MPEYVIHAIDTDPSHGKRFQSKELALTQLRSWQKLTLLLDHYEKVNWRHTAYNRITDSSSVEPDAEVCFRLAKLESYTCRLNNMLYVPDGALDAEFTARFPHASSKHPGKIVFYASEQAGYEGRLTSMRPGIYMQTFWPHVSATFAQEVIAEVKMLEHPEVKVTKDAEEILTIYRTGPRSCMSAPTGDYESCMHPTAVYAHRDTDLAVAYWGEIETNIRGRAVVWPERKQYVRTYGDEVFAQLLEQSGYRRVDRFDGARLAAISDDDHDGYVMPYLDGCTGLTLDRLKKQFVIVCENAGSCDYQCKNTHGLTCDVEPTHECEHCGNEVDNRDDTYCESCYDRMIRCYNCEEPYFNHRYVVELGNSGDYVCENCWNAYEQDCRACGRTSYVRRPDPDHLCDDCDHLHQCEGCHEWVEEKLNDDDRCPQCAPPEAVEAELADEPTPTANTTPNTTEVQTNA